MIRALLITLLVVSAACAIFVTAARGIGERLPNGVIAYTRNSRDGGALVALDVTTGIQADLTHSTAAGSSHPNWSADGAKLAYQRIGEGASQICVFTASRFCYPPVGQWDHSPRWSPDGRWLAFLSGNSTLFVRGDETIRQVGSANRLILSPIWSPLGDRLAFVQSSGPQTGSSLFTVRPDLSDPQAVFSGDVTVSTPAWSPDGTRIAFVGLRQSSANLYLVSLESGDITQITDGGRDNLPTWSPDGSQIAFVSTRRGDSGLFVVDADGANERQLTRGTLLFEVPVWSPDGTALAFSSVQGGEYELFIVDLAKGDVRRLTFDEGDHLNPVWRP